MDNKIQPTNNPQVGNILIINTGSTTTKLGYYSDGVRVFDTKLEHTAEDVAKYPSVMDQSDIRGSSEVHRACPGLRYKLL